MNGIFQRLFSIILIFAFLIPSVSRAESDSLTITGKRAKIIGKAAMYGAGGGLVVGLASQVFKKKTKNISISSWVNLSPENIGRYDNKQNDMQSYDN